MRRRLLLVLPPAVLGLAACGFQLRQAPDFAFSSLYAGSATSALGNELKASIAATGKVQVLTDARQMAGAQAVLEVLTDQRERVIVGRSAAGQVREMQLRTRFKFRLRTPQGKDLIPDTELLQQRDISYNETSALAKEAEELMLYRDMQTDLVQQVMRRLAAVREL